MIQNRIRASNFLFIWGGGGGGGGVVKIAHLLAQLACNL